MSGRGTGPVGASTVMPGNYGGGSVWGAVHTSTVIASPMSVGFRNKLAICWVDSPVARPANSPAGGVVSPSSGVASGGWSEYRLASSASDSSVSVPTRGVGHTARVSSTKNNFASWTVTPGPANLAANASSSVSTNGELSPWR